jgi:hypothetical protein
MVQMNCARSIVGDSAVGESMTVVDSEVFPGRVVGDSSSAPDATEGAPDPDDGDEEGFRGLALTRGRT